MKKLAEKLGSLKNVDPELLTRLQLIAGSTKETFTKTQNINENVQIKYGQGGNEVARHGGAYSVSGKDDPYGSVDVYTAKKKKSPYDK